MVRKLAAIWFIGLFALTGCFQSGRSPAAGRSPGIDTPAGMINYLQQQNPPALKAVEQWQNDYGPGLKILTQHYQLYTTMLEPLMLRELPGFLESAYRGYNTQFPKPIDTKTTFTVYLFAERGQWDSFTVNFAGPNASVYRKIKAGAYYLNGACVVYNIGRERTFSALGHEGWHQFNSRHFKFRLPSWLDEGVAMLFEVSRYEHGLFYFEPGRNLNRLGALKKTLLGNRMIPLRQLLAMNPGQVLATNENEAVSAFYSQSYALVRFLREDGYGKRLANYHELLLGGLHGNWPLSDEARKIASNRNIPLTVRFNSVIGPKLFEYYISNDFEQIEQEYRRFCGKLVYHIRLK